MKEFVIRAVRPGKSVTSTEPRDFTINSSYNTLKVHTEQYGTVDVPTNTTVTENVTHNLGYKPIVLLYFQHPEDSKWHHAPCRADINAGYSDYAMCGGWEYTDTNVVKLSFYDTLAQPIPGGSSPVTVPYKCYVFVDPRKDAWYE